MTNPNIPILQPRLMYGLRTDVKGNAQFISDDEVIYPVGGLLAANNFAQKRQRFVRLPEKGKNVTRILISPNQKIIAIAERGDKPTIYLYDSATLKKKKHLQIPPDRENNAREFFAMDFTYDSKAIVAITGEPDWFMYMYKCERGKVESSVKGNNLNNTGTVSKVACNPNDINLVAIVGSTVFKLMACSEKVWRQFGYSKSDNLNLSDVIWLTQDRLLAATVEGKFMYFENGELRLTAWAGDLPVLSLNVHEKEHFQKSSSQGNISEPSADSIESEEDYEIRCLRVFPRGFAFAYLNGTIHFYEKETPHKYKKRNVYKVPNNNIIREEADAEYVMNEINGFDINPSQERLVVTCKQNQLFTVKLWGVDMITNPEVYFTEYGHSLHHGPIGGIDVCSWKPIFLTSGEWDRTLRIWNYETDTIELCKQFQEDIRGVALHPAGLYAVVGFSDKLRYLTIMIDDLVVTREFPIRNCRTPSFSKMGHYFAATNGSLIQVYSTVTFENVFNFRGHSGKLISMAWVQNDHKAATCGNEGAVYEWEVSTQKRIAETIVKTCSFTGVVVESTGKYVYSIGSDGLIRQIVESNIHREVMVHQGGLDAIAIANSNQMLFVSGDSGTVYSVLVPILDVAEFVEFGGHRTTVSKMVISYDDKYLITASVEGVICVWKIMNAEGKTVKLEKDFVPSTDILITRVDLEGKIDLINTLQLRMHELVTEHTYQKRNMDSMHNLKIKEIHEGYCGAIETLKQKNEQLDTDHAQELSNMTLEMNNLKLNHEQYLQKMDILNNDKLIVEYDKYLQLEEKMSKLRSNYEAQLEGMREEKMALKESMNNDFMSKLQDKDVQIEELHEEQRAKNKEHEVIKQQIEDDADREIYELKTLHEKILKEEQDVNVRLKGETSLIKKKLLSAEKEIEELKHTVYIMKNSQVKFKALIKGMEKDVSDLKKEVSERDSSIQDKEKRIFELKRKNQELEKFKFILDYKIKELKSQIEPRDRQIREQTDQINEMVNELEHLQKLVERLEIHLKDLREQLNSADNELKKEQGNKRACKAMLKSMKNDLHNVTGLLQEPGKLAKALKEMYHKYSVDKEFEIIHAEEEQAKNEFLRQREFLERNVKTLQLQIAKFSSSGGDDKVRLVDENSKLIEDTNYLRTRLKTETDDKKKMETLFGISGRYMNSKQAQKLLNEAVATTHEVHEEYDKKLLDNSTTINALEGENSRLISKIIDQNIDNV
ncbi:hypothetical protein FQA39_LY04116 [Lamprigera yunnana]|nr:hypothetical protein FQA39_LY04116 [Lamprigera yunnana]